MTKLTASTLVKAISLLPRDIRYNYINVRTKGFIKIVRVSLPEGPISIKRWNPEKAESEATAKEESISAEMIWRIANAFVQNQPINFDRVLGGSYNTRSVLEALLAHTPEFYFCHPGRFENIAEKTSIKKGHKHLIWHPDKPHVMGKVERIETDLVISEMPSIDAIYDSILPSKEYTGDSADIEIRRTHAMMQASLLFIGRQLKYDTWIANNDKGILIKGVRIGEMEGVIGDLHQIRQLQAHEEAIKAALLIDCIWFKNGRLMPAVMEVEHSTGIVSGLSRMKNFKDLGPDINTKYVIIAPDEDRDKVIKHANKEQFKDMNTRFFSYSSVKELYALCTKRKIKGVTEEFLECYMESVVMN
jgi:type II restriction enzyme